MGLGADRRYGGRCDNYGTDVVRSGMDTIDAIREQLLKEAQTHEAPRTVLRSKQLRSLYSGIPKLQQLSAASLGSKSMN